MSYENRHPGPHTCSFRTAVFNDLLKQNTKYQNKIPKYANVIIRIFLIKIMVSAWFLHVS